MKNGNYSATIEKEVKTIFLPRITRMNTDLKAMEKSKIIL